MSAIVSKNQPPIVENINARMASLERRADHIKRRLDGDAKTSTYNTTPAAEYDRAELAAIRAALQCMEYVRTFSAS